MPQSAQPSDPRVQEEALISLFAGRGFVRIEPPILQPLEPFLDLSGEDLRRRMFVTQDEDGQELCLRPEYTIPVCRQVLAHAGAVMPTALAYQGPVFRFRPGESGEFVQAGVESFGRDDREAAEAEIVAIAHEALVALGIAHPQMLLGDVGLFNAVLGGLTLPPGIERRLRRIYATGHVDAATLRSLGKPEMGPRPGGVANAFQGQDPAVARLFVEDMLRIAGISNVSGRSAGAIATRFLAQAGEARSGLSDEQASVLERYFAVTGHPDHAAHALRALAEEAAIDLGEVLDHFETRTGFIEAHGVDLASVRFEAAFGRNLDYYTGMVFEMRAGRDAASRPLVGGGRYDGLLRRLGAPHDIPAVGCSVWLDRVAAGLAP